MSGRLPTPATEPDTHRTSPRSHQPMAPLTGGVPGDPVVRGQRRAAGRSSAALGHVAAPELPPPLHDPRHATAAEHADHRPQLPASYYQPVPAHDVPLAPQPYSTGWFYVSGPMYVAAAIDWQGQPLLLWDPAPHRSDPAPYSAEATPAAQHHAVNQGPPPAVGEQIERPPQQGVEQNEQPPQRGVERNLSHLVAEIAQLPTFEEWMEWRRAPSVPTAPAASAGTSRRAPTAASTPAATTQSGSRRAPSAPIGPPPSFRDLAAAFDINEWLAEQARLHNIVYVGPSTTSEFEIKIEEDAVPK